MYNVSNANPDNVIFIISLKKTFRDKWFKYFF